MRRSPGLYAARSLYLLEIMKESGASSASCCVGDEGIVDVDSCDFQDFRMRPVGL